MLINASTGGKESESEIGDKLNFFDLTKALGLRGPTLTVTCFCAIAGMLPVSIAAGLPIAQNPILLWYTLVV